MQRKGPEMTESQLVKAQKELNNSIKDTNRETHATDKRINELDEKRVELANSMEEANVLCRNLKDEEHKLSEEMNQVCEQLMHSQNHRKE